MVPSLVSMLLDDKGLEMVDSASYRRVYRFKKDIYNYYYCCKFLSNLLEKEKVKKFMSRWKF